MDSMYNNLMDDLLFHDDPLDPGLISNFSDSRRQKVEETIRKTGMGTIRNEAYDIYHKIVPNSFALIKTDNFDADIFWAEYDLFNGDSSICQ